MFDRKGYLEIELVKVATPIEDEDALMEIAVRFVFLYPQCLNPDTDSLKVSHTLNRP
jgi:hypothetical protein